MGSGTDLYEYEDARLRKGEIGLETPKQQESVITPSWKKIQDFTIFPSTQICLRGMGFSPEALT